MYKYASFLTMIFFIQGMYSTSHRVQRQYTESIGARCFLYIGCKKFVFIMYKKLNNKKVEVNP